MTDFTQWTDEQVNGAIFKKQGWSHQDKPDKYGASGYWIMPNGYLSLEAPDFCTDWRLAGMLLEEMGGEIVDKMTSLFYFPDESSWRCCWYSPKVEGWEGGGKRLSPCRAISEAWLVWKELE